MAEAPPILFRQVNSADLEVPGYVLPKIGQLQSRANVIGQEGRFLAVSSAEVQDQMADRVRRVLTISQELLEGLIAFDDLVLFEGKEEIEEGFRGDVKLLNRLAQGYHDRVPWPTIIAAQELFAPPTQQLQRVSAASHFVG